MSLDLNNLLSNQVGGILSRYAAQALGETPANADKAAGAVIPAIVAGLVHQAGTESKATELFNLVNGPLVDKNWVTTLKDGDTSNAGRLIDLGKQWLGTFLGDHGTAVENEVAERAGVKAPTAATLLALGVPLVLSALRGYVQTHNLNRNQFYGELVSQRSWLERLLDNKLLAALGIPSLAALFTGLNGWGGSLFGHHSTAAGAPTRPAAAPVMRDEVQKSPGWLKWVALGLGALLLLWLLKSCMGNNDNLPPPAASEPVVAASAPAPVAPASETAPASDSGMSATPASAIEPASGAASAVTASSEPNPDESAVMVENGMIKFYFATGKAEVAKDAKEKAGELLKQAKDGKKLIVSGFTDSTGNAAANKELSKKRALAVKAFLVGEGIPEGQIELKKPEDTVGATGKNQEGRRVEVTIQ